MCGNGKSCEECGRGPCGPSYTPRSNSDYTDEGLCYFCRGRGEILIRGTNRDGDYNKCKDCGGTGKSAEARYQDMKDSGELKKKIEDRRWFVTKEIERIKFEKKRLRHELAILNEDSMTLCDDCKGIGYTTSRFKRGDGDWKIKYHECPTCKGAGMLEKSKRK